MKTSTRTSTVGAVMLAVGILSAGTRVQAAAFNGGDLVVEQVGGTANYGAGAAALTSAGTAVFLDEFTTSAQTTPVQQFALPTTTSGSQLSLVESGSATSDGYLSRSADGNHLVLGGYNSTVGTAGVASSSSSTVPRVIARFGLDGSFDTSTSSTTALTGGNFRSVTVVNGITFYGAGSGSGTVPPLSQFTYQGTSSSDVTITSSGGSATNLRNVEIFTPASTSTQSLYYSSGSATAGIYTFGGLPTTGSNNAATLFVTDASKSPYAFSISPDGKTVFVADDSAAGSGGGIQKYTSATGAAGSFTLVATFATPSRGLTVSYSGTTATLYATTSAASANALYAITDNLANSAAGSDGGFASQSFTTLATAPANSVFRGVDFAPVPEPATWAGGVLSVLALVWTFARRRSGASLASPGRRKA